MAMDELLCDLDGVLVDFVRGAFAVHGIDFPYCDVRWEIDKQVFGEADRNKFWEPLKTDFWSNCPWTTEGKALWDYLWNVIGRDKLWICTSPSYDPESATGKMKWIQRELPGMERRFVITPHKWLCALPGRLLVDDNEPNCERFVKHGGKSVLIPRPWNKRRDECDKDGNFDLHSIFQEVTQAWRS